MIDLIYAGHLGNNLFNYALGRYLSEELGLALACRLPGTSAWGEIEARSGIVDKLPGHLEAFEDVPQSLPGRVIEAPQLRYVMGEKILWSGHSLNVGHILRTGRDRRVVLYGYFQRTEYYLPFADRIRRWFRMRPVDLPVTPGPRDVVVHVRRSLDMRVLDRRLDVSYYVRALEDLHPERVYVVGLGLDRTLREALKPWDPAYLELDARRTLSLMTRARRIVMANSTFSWWGAFLSEAERIIYPSPVRGMMSLDHMDIDLRVPESRYTCVEDVPLEPWRFVRCADKWDFAREMELFVLSVPGQPPTWVHAAPTMELLLKWMKTVEGPFGLHELGCNAFGTRQQVAPALVSLLRAGVLVDCDRAPNDPPLEHLLLAGTAFGNS